MEKLEIDGIEHFTTGRMEDQPLAGPSRFSEDTLEQYASTYPSLNAAKLYLDIDVIRAAIEADFEPSLSSNIPRLTDDFNVTNSVVSDLIDFVKELQLTNEQFFSFVRCVLPSSLSECLGSVKTFAAKIKTFKLNLAKFSKKKKRNPVAFNDFISQSFPFEVKAYLTPQKRKLREENQALKKSNWSLSEDIEKLKSSKQEADIISEDMIRQQEQQMQEEIEEHEKTLQRKNQGSGTKQRFITTKG